MGSTDRNLAVLAATAGDFTAAESHFEAAMAFNERLGAAPWIARTAAAWAVMLEGRGLADDVDRAAALRAKAEHVGHEAGIRVRGIRGFGDG
jgi:hypothetical protein